MLSAQYMKGHPKAGQPTFFAEKLTGPVPMKIHTVRAGYDFWKKRIDEILEGKAILSVRRWEAVPYRSKQKTIREFTSRDGIGIQHIGMHKPNPGQICWNVDDRKIDRQLNDIARNDGLTCEDFVRWFFPNPKEPDVLFDGAIIHFTPSRY